MLNYKTLNVFHVIFIHDAILAESTGLPGLCKHKSLEGALVRIDNKILYEGVNDLSEIAALYGITIAQGHVFNDGNKRTTLIAMSDFLLLNNYFLILLQVKQPKLW